MSVPDLHSQPLDIVVPVHNAFEVTKRCLESILQYRNVLARLLIIDDGSTDPNVRAYLDRLQTEKNLEILRVETSGGFVSAVNRGMRASKSADVLLLNSDVLITPNAIEGIRACAYSDETTGIVSPLSNNATICSVPIFVANNPIPENFLDLAAKIRASNSYRYPQLPTAVGFCMYIKRQVIEAVGYFDEVFGRGYCEENDFCERAKEAGYKIRLCDNAYVPHLGRASFGDEGAELLEKNRFTLYRRYPNYQHEIVSFMGINPLWDVQAKVARLLERPSAAESEKEHLQHLAHNRFAAFPVTAYFDRKATNWKNLLRSVRLGAQISIEQQYRFAAFRNAEFSNDVTDIFRDGGELGMRSQGLDPFVILEPLNIPRAENLIRIRMRSDSTRTGCAQLYFAHGEHENFLEEKSIVIPLPDHGKYTEIWLDVNLWSGSSRWRAGETIRRLRFDPLKTPGKVWLKDISFGRYRKQAQDLPVETEKISRKPNSLGFTE